MDYSDISSRKKYKQYVTQYNLFYIYYWFLRLHVDDKKGSSTKAPDTYRLSKIPHMPFLLILKVFSFFPAGLIQSIISIILIDHFHLDAQANGLMLAYFGILTIVKLAYS